MNTNFFKLPLYHTLYVLYICMYVCVCIYIYTVCMCVYIHKKESFKTQFKNVKLQTSPLISTLSINKALDFNMCWCILLFSLRNEIKLFTISQLNVTSERDQPVNVLNNHRPIRESITVRSKSSLSWYQDRTFRCHGAQGHTEMRV